MGLPLYTKPIYVAEEGKVGEVCLTVVDPAQVRELLPHVTGVLKVVPVLVMVAHTIVLQ